jgi:hypothetical protein
MIEKHDSTGVREGRIPLTGMKDEPAFHAREERILKYV